MPSSNNFYLKLHSQIFDPVSHSHITACPNCSCVLTKPETCLRKEARRAGLPWRPPCGRQCSQGQNTHEVCGDPWGSGDHTQVTPRLWEAELVCSTHTASHSVASSLQHLRPWNLPGDILLPLLIPGLQFPSSTYCSLSAEQPRGHQQSMRKSSPQRYGSTLYN